MNGREKERDVILPRWLTRGNKSGGQRGSQRLWLLSDQPASVTVRLPGSYRFTSRQDGPAALSGPSSATSTTSWKDLSGTHIGTSARLSARTFVSARAGKLSF